MAGLIVIVLYAYKVTFLALSTCVKIIEFSLKNEAYLHVYKGIIIIPAIYERGLLGPVNKLQAMQHWFLIITDSQVEKHKCMYI